MLYNFCFYFMLFLTYSIVGWTFEVISCSILQKKLVINRGFLIGPYCPIYGTSALLMLLFLERYLYDPIVLFIMATLVCTIMEYVTSYVMEKIFKVRWWDYSEKKFNLNGRVCLFNSCMFGVLGLVLMYLLNPFYAGLLSKIPNVLFMVITLTCFIIFLSDVVLSLIIMFQLKINMNLMGRKDATEEISKKVREALAKNRIFTGRLSGAFPKAKSLLPHDPIPEMKKMLEAKRKQRKNQQ